MDLSGESSRKRCLRVFYVCRYLEIDLTRDSWRCGVFCSVLTCVCVCVFIKCVCVCHEHHV